MLACVSAPTLQRRTDPCVFSIESGLNARLGAIATKREGETYACGIPYSRCCISPASREATRGFLIGRAGDYFLPCCGGCTGLCCAPLGCMCAANDPAESVPTITPAGIGIALTPLHSQRNVAKLFTKSSSFK